MKTVLVVFFTLAFAACGTEADSTTPTVAPEAPAVDTVCVDSVQ